MTGGCAKKHTPASFWPILIFIRTPFPLHYGVIGTPIMALQHPYSGIIYTTL